MRRSIFGSLRWWLLAMGLAALLLPARAAWAASLAEQVIDSFPAAPSGWQMEEAYMDVEDDSDLKEFKAGRSDISRSYLPPNGGELEVVITAEPMAVQGVQTVLDNPLLKQGELENARLISLGGAKALLDLAGPKEASLSFVVGGRYLVLIEAEDVEKAGQQVQELGAKIDTAKLGRLLGKLGAQ